MWQIRHFKTAKTQQRWIDANQRHAQIEVLFVNNGFAVQYRPLRIVG